MTFIDPFDDYNVQAGQGAGYMRYEQAQEEGVSFRNKYLGSSSGGNYLRCGYLYQGCGTIYGSYWC